MGINTTSSDLSDEKMPLSLHTVRDEDDSDLSYGERPDNDMSQHLLSNQSKKKQHSHGSYGSFIAYCFCVNYILGVGVLGVPHGFFVGGVLFGPLFLLVVTVMAALVVVWLLETMSRAQAFYTAAEGGDSTLDEENKKEKRHQGSQFFIGTRKFEVNELCGMFLGRFGRRIYELCLCLYMWGGLWSYASVFAQSMASHLPLYFPHVGWFTCDVYADASRNCTLTYLVYIGLFAIIVVPLTCLDLTEQKPLQVVLTIFRYVALGLMIVVIFVSMFSDPYSRFPHNPHKGMEKKGPYLSPFDWVNPAGFYLLMPVCIFSQILHHSTPGLSQPVKNKKHVSSRILLFWSF
jgi:amino acid permease